MPTLLIVIAIGLLGGIAVTLQAPFSSMITQKIGMLESILIVHLGGLLLVAVPLLAQRGGQLGQWRNVPWYALTAGFYGVGLLAAINYTFPRIGAAGTVTLILAGQLVMAAVLDHFGVLGAEVRAFNLQRLLGFAVLFAGVWLIVRG